MSRQVKKRNVFDLDRNELEILRLIEMSALSISDIANKTRIPRTTIYGLVISLLRRDLIEIVPRGKRKLYQLKSYEVVERNIDELRKKIYPKTPFLNILGLRVSEDTEIKLHRGVEAMLRIFEKLTSENKNGRIMGIQPNASIYHVLQKVQIKDLVRVNNAVKKNNIIMEGIMEENSTAFLGAILNKKDTESLLKSFIGRHIDDVSVPSEFLQFESEIYMTNEIAYIMEWDAEVCIEIKNPHILKLLLAMFYATKALGKRFHQGEDMARYLKRIG